MRASERDTRVLRAAREVLAKYQLIRTTVDDEARFAVTGGSRPYSLSLSITWARPPTCTCPDSQHVEVKGYCKHAIAAMLSEPDLRCQLLEAYL
ncbi:MAG: hypothetical protein EXR69_11730 [Myxococcales bacterium]|nr:hypothetical protein [Myxococcales bacterium]